MDEFEGMDAAENQETGSTPAHETLNQFFGAAKDVIHRYQHCVMCGGNLHFTYLTDFNRNLAEETARCPECGVRARHAMHRLQ